MGPQDRSEGDPLDARRHRQAGQLQERGHEVDVTDWIGAALG